MKIKITVKGIDSLFSFFDASEQKPYLSTRKVIAQLNADTCVAACARMILADCGIDAPESYLASALETRGGAYLSKAPQVLRDFGVKGNYEWSNKLTIADLSKAVKNRRAIILLQRKNAEFGHSIIVDDIIDDKVRLCDPLPVGQGKSYAVSLDIFTQVWLESGVVYVK